ncbi:PASTA domain-containing protein [Streptomyces sp. NPDC005318]|uniref:PASTA domain-containing protein n=1 Tax=Streptomyces sp. NPDC005318 TaxID=3157031 RepID=UPI0033A51656
MQVNNVMERPGFFAPDPFSTARKDLEDKAAVAQLNDLGFKNASRTDADSEKPASQVVSQNPLSFSRSCKRAAGLRARYDCVPPSNG